MASQMISIVVTNSGKPNSVVKVPSTAVLSSNRLKFVNLSNSKIMSISIVSEVSMHFDCLSFRILLKGSLNSWILSNAESEKNAWWSWENFAKFFRIRIGFFLMRKVLLIFEKKNFPAFKIKFSKLALMVGKYGDQMGFFSDIFMRKSEISARKIHENFFCFQVRNKICVIVDDLAIISDPLVWILRKDHNHEKKTPKFYTNKYFLFRSLVNLKTTQNDFKLDPGERNFRNFFFFCTDFDTK